MSRKLALMRAAKTAATEKFSPGGWKKTHLAPKPITLAKVGLPDPSEAEIHHGVVMQLRARAWPDVLWWHTPNSGVRSKRSGAFLQSMGMLAGVSDILAVRKGNIYAMELKKRGGRMTDAQQDFQWRLSAAGGFCCMCDEYDRAIAVLESWKLIRGQS